MLLKKPLISYNILDTQYEDNMYEIMGNSFESETLLLHKGSKTNNIIKDISKK